MNEVIKSIQNNGPIIMNASIMFIGIFASFLSATVKKKIQVGGLIVLALIFNILTWIVYERKDVLRGTIILTVIWIVVCAALIWNKEIVSRKRIDRMIRIFTDDADQSKPICIFGGDLDFFGDVVINPTKKEKLFKRYEIIEFNKQYNQLKDKGFPKIEVLSVKPDSDSDRDQKTRIRIGFLKENLKGNLEVKFFEEKKCNSCSERTTCLACNVCKTCPEGKKCKRMGVQLCDKLRDELHGRCYNPDMQLRGRIAKKKSDGSTSAAIVTTYKSGKSYILKEYSSNTRECTIYQKIWEVWWEKCKMDKEFMNRCVNEYRNFVVDTGESGNK